MIKEISAVLEEAHSLLNNFIGDSANSENLAYASKKLAQCFVKGGKVLACGNGGSMCDAMHFAEELTARFKTNRISLPAIAISDPSHLSCAANDFGYDFVFSRYLEGLGQEGDILLGISTSGNSRNIIEAVKAAKKKKIYSICLLGKDGGELLDMCDLPFVVSHHKTERIQEIHIKIIHILIEFTEKLLKKDNYIE